MTSSQHDIQPPDTKHPDFWPVFVISLPDATERRASITAQLSALSIPFEFMEAIDGREGLPEDCEASIDRVATKRQLGRPMSDAEYACALSHMLIYKRVVTENLPGAIVLEDDAIIGQEFAMFRAKRCYELGALMQMDHVYAYIWKGAKAETLLEGVVAAVAAQNAGLTTGYSISQHGAKYFLAHGLPITGPADWPADVTKLPALLTIPCIVGHPPLGTSQSSIEHSRSKLTKVADERRSWRLLSGKYWRSKARRLWAKRVS